MGLERALLLTALVVCAEDLGSVPNTHMVANSHLLTPSPGN